MKKTGRRKGGLKKRLSLFDKDHSSLLSYLKSRRRWFGKALLGSALGLGSTFQALQAQEAAPPQSFSVVSASLTLDDAVTSGAGANQSAGTTFSNSGTGMACDPCAPAWCDPISRVPNFLGDFFARGAQVSRNTFLLETLTYTGAGAEGFTQSGFVIQAPLTANGPGGPFTLTKSIPYPFPGKIKLAENAELSAQVQAEFPGASFVNGGGTRIDFDPTIISFFYNYLFESGQNILVNLPNPAGGGLVGRNRYFENGSPLPQDRVYFFYNRVGNFQGLGNGFDINRYVFGAEKTFLDNYVSVEVRVPFAGTANSDQVAGQELAVDHTEFGNVGLAVKGLLYRTPNFAASVGLGVSAPSADDSRLLVGDATVVEIENRTWLIQPMFGAAWAPNDRCYTQFGVQFDFDPSGNPVRALDADGGLSRVGVLNDQHYAFLNSAAGYWIYQNDRGGRCTGAAIQGELNYNRSFGHRDVVGDGTVAVSDLFSHVDSLNGTLGTIFQFGERTSLSLGVSFPLSGDHLYDWTAIAQLNYNFGAGR